MTGEIFRNRLKDARKQAGRNQLEICALVNASQQTISNWENGRAFPDLVTLATIAEYLDVSVDWLLGLSDDPAPRRAVAPEVMQEAIKEKPEMTEEELAAKLPEDIREAVLALIRIATTKK